jgi:hypothetical protein
MQTPAFRHTFDAAKYKFTNCGVIPTDEYHVHLLHEAACLDTGVPLQQRVGIEVGSFRGWSTAALIEAINKGKLQHLHIVEPKPTPSLLRVIGMCAFPGRVTLHTQCYWELKIDNVDFVFIDGDHRWPAVADTLKAIADAPSMICMHDTHAWPRLKDCWGSVLAAKCLRDIKGRECFRDFEDRPGQFTFRGLLVSARSGIDLAQLRSI